MVAPAIAVFRGILFRLVGEVEETTDAALLDRAKALARAIEAKAPVHKGVLKTTVRVVQGKNPLSVRVVAGGKRTVRTSVSSQPYDYARADEFGTVDMPAQPFFFNTYRLMKSHIRRDVKSKIAGSIRKRSAE